MNQKLARIGLAVAVVASLIMGTTGQTLAAAPTSAPVIIAPADLSTVNANPTLQWAAVAGATKYRVQISTSLLFSTTIYNVETTALQATPQNLLPFTTLYWRVAGEDSGSAQGPYANASFTKTMSSAPVPVTPTDTQTLTFPGQPVVFSWQPVPGAVSYTVQIGNSSDFIGAAQYDTANTSYTLTDTQAFTLSDGVSLQSWWWQVRAKYIDNSVTAWSTPWSYQVNWPATPQLESPINAAVGITDTVFSWDPVLGAASYDIQVSSNCDWQNGLVINQQAILSTRFAPDVTLNNDSYCWHVRARAAGNVVNYGQWSTTFSFSRSWSTRPKTVWPHWAGGEADLPEISNLEFSWTPASAGGEGWVDHASHYEIQIGTNVNFSNNTYSLCDTDQTTYSPYAGIMGGGEPGGCNIAASLSVGTIYYWRVKALDGPVVVNGLWDNTSADDTQRFIYRPDMPDLSCGPADAAHVQTPVLCWAPVSGAEQYRVTIKRNDDQPVEQSLTYALSYTPLQRLDPAYNPYTWSVETVDSQNHVGYVRGFWPSFYLDTPTTDTSLALLTPAAGAHSLRMPSMTWQPYTGASYYKVRYGATSGSWYVDPLSGGSHLPFAGFTYAAAPLAPARYYWAVEAYSAADVKLATSSPSSFWVGTTSAGTSWIIPWNNYLTPECIAKTDPQTARCTPNVGQTQEMTWLADPSAGAYLVYVAKDSAFTNMYRTYETGQTSITPRESWLDSQAGQSYFWFVRPCIDWQATDCGPGPDTNAGINNASAYRKSSPAQTGLVTTTAANPPVALSTIPDQVTFNWADYMTTSQASPFPVTSPDPAYTTRVTQEAKKYRVQVSTTADFSVILDTRTVDQTQYTPWAITYPEGPLYWRVQALDGSENPLTMSAPASVTKASAPVALTSPAHTATVTGVPYFQWAPQNWAAKYQIEVYRNGDLNFASANLLFQTTTRIAAWSPTSTMPAGVYAWHVRRQDANDRFGPWSTGRTFTLQPAAPTLNTPADLALLDGSNLYFTWLGVPGAVSYKFQTSTVADFATNVIDVTTVMTAWSPISAYAIGSYYWRVNLLDASNNVLSTSNSRRFTVGTPPGAPTGPTAVAGNASATISWTAPVSSGSSPITGYIVTSRPEGKTCSSNSTTLHCTISLLTNGSPYTFYVQAITDFGTGPASVDSNQVTPTAISTFLVTGSPTQAAGVAFNIVVTATDSLGGIQAGYRGTVHFTSSDPSAVLPANYTYVLGDAGAHTFSVTLRTPGAQSITATDTVIAGMTGTLSAISVASSGATYTATNPARVLDSRPTGTGHTNIGLTGKFTAGTPRTFTVSGVIGVGGSAIAVPTTATAVTGNLTVVSGTAAGLVALGPTIGATGDTTTINFTANEVRANNVTLLLGGGGTLMAVYRTATAGATIDLIFDVTGYFTPDAAGATYHTVAPGRVLDSRPTGSGHTNIGLGGKFNNKSPRYFSVVGVKGLGWSSALVPAGATAVTANLTVTNATSAGYVSVGPTIAAVPSTSTVNVAKGSNVANGVSVKLNSTAPNVGKLQAVWVGTVGSSADILVDITGYFTGDLSGLSFHPMAPVRLLDSSTNLGLSGTFASKTPRTLTVAGVAAIPADAAGISGNLTVVNASSNGYAFISPDSIAVPSSSTLNITAHLNAANGFDVAFSSGGVAIVWVGTVGSTADVQLDVTGFWK